MTFLCLNEYKKRIKIKSKVQIQSIRDLKKLENNYTRITIILTILFATTRFADSLTTLINRVIFLKISNQSNITISLLNLIRQITLLMYYGSHSFNQLLYIWIDTNLKQLTKEKLSKLKVEIFNILKFLFAFI